MGGSYKQCDECGKRALSIATRCPGCGREFPAPPAPEGGPALDLRRYLSPGLAGLLAVGAVLMAIEIGGAGRFSEPSPSFVPGSLASDSIASRSEVAYALTPPASGGEVLVARTWTNVRRSRSTRAGLEAVLTPGDTVFADSLERDWYRVALDGEVLGYVHRTTLETSIP